MTYPTSFDRYLSCFSAAHCHLVPAPQGKPVSCMDGDQPTSAIEPVSRQGVQSIAMYPVDGDFIIFAFKDYDEAKTFAHRVGQKFPLGTPEVTTVQPGRISYIRELVDLAYVAWRVAGAKESIEGCKRGIAQAKLRFSKAKSGGRESTNMARDIERMERILADSEKSIAVGEAKLQAAKERDRNLARQAVKEATSPGPFGGMSTPSERNIFEAARTLGYTL